MRLNNTFINFISSGFDYFSTFPSKNAFHCPPKDTKITSTLGIGSGFESVTHELGEGFRMGTVKIFTHQGIHRR